MKILLVDDDKNLRLGIKLSLESEGFEVTAADTYEMALRLINEERGFEAYVLDIKLNANLTGIELYQKVRALNDQTPVIFISSGASLSEVAEGMRLGAFDFLEKPFAPDKLIATLKNVQEISSLKEKLAFYNQTLLKDSDIIIGQSKAFQEVLNAVSQAAPTQSTILITGESGTGKELVAKRICALSKRSTKPFIKVNCSSIPENLIESELFGYEKGAFTGAISTKKGYFELAHQGTIFLDEIGDMNLSAQAKVLRALQEQEIQKLGSEKIIKVNVRVIAATNKDLQKGVAEGWFREDLFYRLNVFPIKTPALRQRKEDIAKLAQYFLETFIQENSMPKKIIDNKLYDRLKEYDWPGNIRELKNIMERIAITGKQRLVESDFLNLGFLEKSHTKTNSRKSVNGFEDYGHFSLKSFKEDMEKRFIIESLKKHQGNIAACAVQLEIERTHLHKKIKQYQIQKREYLT
ncbi:MAG: sigma-54 dependent transcriptional regulator [Bdellovibrionaceae bacterium]|nr:sigma-54 dependent transcriptional regulator [Pseudobdellovibrionaceae bacterium]